MDYQRLPVGLVRSSARYRHTGGQNWAPANVHDRCHDFWYRLLDRCIFSHGLVLSSRPRTIGCWRRSEEHTSELQSRFDLVCRLLLEKKKTPRSVSEIG